MSILFISNSNFSPGLSGGDRIFLELLRRWSKYTPLALMGATETQNLLRLYKLKNIKFYLTSSKNKHTTPNTLNVLLLQVGRTIKSLFYIVTNSKDLSQYTTIYSVSDFYADFFPALFIKLLHPQVVWIAGFYLFAPSPSSADSPYFKTGQFFKGHVYYYAQKITLFLTKKFADYVFVTSVPDISKFLCPRLRAKKIIVIRGGVDVSSSSKYLKNKKLLPPSKRQYLACFIGRLHPQKGVLELIEIWKFVTQKLPNAKLAIIGNGQLKSQIVKKIKLLNLSQNIDLLGFLDGVKKEKIFQQSSMVLHPAIYDSGGMASAEAMVWGLPAISFDLEALKTYYPQGMLKIPCLDLSGFAATIIKLSTDNQLYQKTSVSARQLILNQWNWDNQAKLIYQQISP